MTKPRDTESKTDAIHERRSVRSTRQDLYHSTIRNSMCCSAGTDGGARRAWAYVIVQDMAASRVSRIGAKTIFAADARRHPVSEPPA